MKFLTVFAIFLSIVLIYFDYKKDKDIKKTILSSFFLLEIITFGIVGNIMRSITPLFLTHFIALVIAYVGMIYYIVRGKIVWVAVIAPIATMLLYLLLVWVGNEHLPTLA